MISTGICSVTGSIPRSFTISNELPACSTISCARCSPGRSAGSCPDISGMGEQEAEKVLVMLGQRPADRAGESQAQEMVVEGGRWVRMADEQGREAGEVGRV